MQTKRKAPDYGAPNYGKPDYSPKPPKPDIPPLKDYQAALTIFISDLMAAENRLNQKAAKCLERCKEGKPKHLEALNHLRDATTLHSALGILLRACEKQARRETKPRPKRRKKEDA